MLHKPPIHKKPMKSCKLTPDLYLPHRHLPLKTLDCVFVLFVVFFPFVANNGTLFIFVICAFTFLGVVFLLTFPVLFAHFVTKDSIPLLVGLLRIIFGRYPFFWGGGGDSSSFWLLWYNKQLRKQNATKRKQKGKRNKEGAPLTFASCTGIFLKERL